MIDEQIKQLEQQQTDLDQKRQQLWQQYVESRYLWNKDQGWVRYWPTQAEAEQDRVVFRRLFGDFKQKA